MNKVAVAKEMLKLAKRLTAINLNGLSESEKKIARKMWEKGYRVCAQITTVDGDFGAPLYFRSVEAIGPFFRSFPTYANPRAAWVIELEPGMLDIIE